MSGFVSSRYRHTFHALRLHALIARVRLLAREDLIELGVAIDQRFARLEIAHSASIVVLIKPGWLR